MGREVVLDFDMYLPHHNRRRFIHSVIARGLKPKPNVLMTQIFYYQTNTLIKMKSYVSCPRVRIWNITISDVRCHTHLFLRLLERRLLSRRATFRCPKSVLRIRNVHRAIRRDAFHVRESPFPGIQLTLQRIPFSIKCV